MFDNKPNDNEDPNKENAEKEINETSSISPSEIYSEDATFIEELSDLIVNEIPGVGTTKRVLQNIKLRISKEYIEEIKRLKATEIVLIQTQHNQNKQIKQLSDVIIKLENRLKAANKK